jgi:hypothetical protein
VDEGRHPYTQGARARKDKDNSDRAEAEAELCSDEAESNATWCDAGERSEVREGRDGGPWLIPSEVYQMLALQNLFCTNWLISRFDLGLVVQNHVQQGTMDFQFTVVFDKTKFAEFVHEKAHARSRRADHFGQRFLTDLSHDRLRPAFLTRVAEIEKHLGIDKKIAA